MKFLLIDTFTYGGISSDFVEDDAGMKSLEKAYDLVLFEPFTFNDNGRILVHENHGNIESVMDHFESSNEDTVFILHPPQPIHEASIYPKQVEELKGFAEEHDIPYIDVWESWPDYNTEELTDYLDGEGHVNSAGVELWAGELVR